MAVFEVPVKKVCYGTIYIRAESEEQASRIAKDAIVHESDYIKEEQTWPYDWELDDNCVPTELDEDEEADLEDFEIYEEE